MTPLTPKFLALAFAVLLVAGCNRDEATRSQISALEARQKATEDAAKKTATSISALETRQSNTEEETKRTNAAQLDLENEVTAIIKTMSSKANAAAPAVMNPAEKGYGIARNEYGVFPVLVEDAQPYLDGYKVRLRIGNLTAATITGVSLEITYGLREPDFPVGNQRLSPTEVLKARQDYVEHLAQNLKQQRTLSVNAENDFLPASWNIVDVVISPAKPEELGRLAIMVKATGMILSNSAAPFRIPRPAVPIEPTGVAGPGEYMVRPGDTGSKIARAMGASLSDIEFANPSVDWRRLKVGQIIKYPPKPPMTTDPSKEPVPVP
jgi:hypothetical protein